MGVTSLSRSPAYYGWLDKLYDLMEWTRSEDGDPAKTSWLCGDPATRDRLGLARKAAAELGADFDVMLAQARELSGAHCDCEIIFNCDDRPEGG
jgi:hypothetical protein